MHRLVFAITAALFAFGFAGNIQADANTSQPTLILASAGTGAADDKETKKEKKKDKRVCKRVAVIGSRIPERICRRQSDWDRMEAQSREELDRANDGSARSVGGSENS
ncbi:MAG: hypothetical protein AAF513_20890 [Pseudomonadota bacterium]